MPVARGSYILCRVVLHALRGISQNPPALCGCTVPMQTIDASRAACSSYGFQPGSDAFAECVQKEQHLHTLLIYAGGGGAASQPQTLPPLSDPAPPMQAPALPPLPQPQTQFCFGSGAFEQCQ